MANLDVSDLLLDPDFVDRMLISRRTYTINDYGQNVLSEVLLPTVGSIQPANAKELTRVPDDLQQRDVRAFYVKAELITDGNGKYPDVLVFKAKRFQIISVEPWNNFGQGWNKGLCVAEKPS